MRVHGDENNSLLYHFSKYNKNKYSARKKGYPGYQILISLNTKIWKLSNKLKDMYSIAVGNDIPQYAETLNFIVKCANLQYKTNSKLHISL